MRFDIHVQGWQELNEALAVLSQNAGARFVAPGLAAAARVAVMRIRRPGFGFRDGPNRRAGRGGGAGRRLRKTIRSGIFKSGRLKGRGARILVGGRSARQANPLIFGQSASPKARPYRGGPQRADPRPFVTDAVFQTLEAQEFAVGQNLRARFPALLRRLSRRRSGGRRMSISNLRGLRTHNRAGRVT